jgi:surfeit locus 1 family protein
MTATLETREARDERRTSPAWRAVVAAATVAAIALFVAAGNWQRDRMHAKEAARAALDAAAALPAVPLPRTDDWSEWRYRRVTLTGDWRGDAQVLIDNKVQGGRAGFHVVTPLVLRDGRVVLVDRGWIAAAGATRVPDVAAPTGNATVDGRIAVPPARYVELGGGASAGRVWQNLDPARIAAASGLPLLPVVVEQDAAGAPADGLVRAWAAPDGGVDTHRIYMMQWYAFAALAAGLWIGFAVRRAMRGRRRR